MQYLILLPVFSWGKMEMRFEKPIEMAEAIETAFRGDLDDLLARQPELDGGIFQAIGIHDPAWRHPG